MEDFKTKDKYYPMLVTNISGRQDDNSIFFDRQKKIKSLPQKAQDLLFSNEIITFIYGVEKKYRLQDGQTEEFSRLVRQYYFRELTKELFIHKISQLCKISEDEASKLFIAINNIKVSDESEDEVKIIKLPLSKAIKKYPQILKQQITTGKIISKPFLKPLVPSVKNWIMVYEKILGVSKHTMIERGEFVFRADATKGMSEEDRKKLLILFKSRDDNSNLVVDEDKGLIVFEVKENNEKSVQKPINEDSNLCGNNSAEGIVSAEYKQQKQTQKKSVDAMDSGNVILRNPSSLGYIHTYSEGVEKTIEEKNIENTPEEVVEIKNPQLRKIAQNANNTLTQIEKKEINDVNSVEKKQDDVINIDNINSNSQPVISNAKINKSNNEIEKKQKTKMVDSGLIHKKQNQIKNIDAKNKKQSKNVKTQQLQKIKTVNPSHDSKVMKEVQNEIVKNRVEMTDKKVDKKKIKNVGNERKQSEMGTPIIQKTVQNSDRTIIKTQQKTSISKLSSQNNKKAVEKQGNIAGEISFSSNHTMPAEKKKPISKQKKYNAFNMKPLGQKYQDDIEK